MPGLEAMTRLQGMIIRFALAALFCALAGCASTTVYRDGKPVLKTQADAQSLQFRQGDTSLKIVGLNHSTPTRAGVEVIKESGNAAAKIGTAVVAKAFAPVP